MFVFRLAPRPARNEQHPLHLPNEPDRSVAGMVGRLNDTRLLENLVKSEKDYYAALIDLLALSHSSVASLTGYGSTLHPACSQAVLGVAECLTAADDGLRGYAESIDDWREKLGEIKRLDLDIENAMRDREIL